MELSRRQVPQAACAGCALWRRVRRVARRLFDHDLYAVRAHRAGARRSAGASGHARRLRSSAPRRSRTFLIDSFQLADPSHARGKEITAREILDQGAARIGKELGAQPDLQATLLDTIGSVYLSLDLPEDAQPLIEQGLAVRRKLFGERHLDVAQQPLQPQSRLREEGRSEDRRSAGHRQPGDQHRCSPVHESVETAGSLCRLGVIQHARGDSAHAEQHLNECLRIRVARLGQDHELVTRAAGQPRAARAGAARFRRPPSACTARRSDRPAHHAPGPSAIHPSPAQPGDGACTSRATSMPPSRCIAQTVAAASGRCSGRSTRKRWRRAGNLGRLLEDRGRFDEAQQTYDDRARREPQGASRAARRRCQPAHRPGPARTRAQAVRGSGTALARSAADLSRNLAARPRLHGRCPDESRPHAAGIEQGAGRGSHAAKRAGRVVEGIRHRQPLVRAGAGISRTRVGACRDDSRKPSPRCWKPTRCCCAPGWTSTTRRPCDAG